MDKRTQDILKKINKSNERPVTRKEDENKDIRESLERAYNAPHLNDEQRGVIKKHLEDPRMYRTEEVVDEKKAREMGADVERDVKKAIAEGHLKDPNGVQERFLREKGIL